MRGKTFRVTVDSILTSKRGKKNLPRWVAMSACQEKGDHRLIDITKKFGLKRTESIPTTMSKLKNEIEHNAGLKVKVDRAM